MREFPFLVVDPLRDGSIAERRDGKQDFFNRNDTMYRKALVVALVMGLGVALTAAVAQPPIDGDRPEAKGPRDGERRPEARGPRDGERRPEGRGPRDGDRPPQGRGPGHPLMRLFDTNKDGVISADEIKKASEVLAKMDKNKDGKLSPNEMPAPPEGFRGPRPDGPRPDGARRPGGPRPEGRPDGPPEGRDGRQPPRRGESRPPRREGERGADRPKRPETDL